MSPLAATVIIPTRDRYDLISDAIGSLERQTQPPDEVIVVDDGSAQIGSVSTPLDLTVIAQPNRGVSAARNRGVQAATGDVVLFLDDDDMFGPSRIENALRVHDEGHTVVTCLHSSSRTEVFGDGRRPDSSGPLTYEMRPAATLVRRATPSLGVTSVLREDFRPLREDYQACEDVEWWLRMAEAGVAVAALPTRDLWVRRHDGPRSGNGVRERLHSSIRLLDDHEEHFHQDREAHSYRLARISLMAAQCGLGRPAMRYALRSLVTHPSGPGLRALSAVPSAAIAPSVRDIDDFRQG